MGNCQIRFELVQLITGYALLAFLMTLQLVQVKLSPNTKHNPVKACSA